MQTVDVVLGVLNKSCVAKLNFVRCGPKGYGLLAITRLLLYSVLAEIFSTRKLGKHFLKNPCLLKKLGFAKLPDRRSIDHWQERYESILDNLIENLVMRFSWV